MLSFLEITERLKDILSKELGNKKVYDKDVAAALGISKENFSVMKKREKVPVEEIALFCAKRGISINWLLFDQDPSFLCEQTQKFAYIKYFKDINASAGGGAINYENMAQKLYLDKELETFFGKENIKNIEALNIIGDSMEPLLRDESIIFIDKSKKDIKKGGIFVFATNAGVFIKRVILKADGNVELISENRIYPKETISIDEVSIVGKVIGSLSKI